MTCTDVVPVFIYSTYVYTTYDYASTSVQNTDAYGGNVTNLSTEKYHCSQIVSGLNTMGASTSAVTNKYTSIERTISDGVKVSGFCTDICNYYGVYSGCFLLSHSTYKYNSNLLVDEIISLRQL